MNTIQNISKKRRLRRLMSLFCSPFCWSINRQMTKQHEGRMAVSWNVFRGKKSAPSVLVSLVQMRSVKSQNLFGGVSWSSNCSFLYPRHSSHVRERLEFSGARGGSRGWQKAARWLPAAGWDPSPGGWGREDRPQTDPRCAKLASGKLVSSVVRPLLAFCVHPLGNLHKSIYIFILRWQLRQTARYTNDSNSITIGIKRPA